MSDVSRGDLVRPCILSDTGSAHSPPATAGPSTPTAGSIGSAVTALLASLSLSAHGMLGVRTLACVGGHILMAYLLWRKALQVSNRLCSSFLVVHGMLGVRRLPRPHGLLAVEEGAADKQTPIFSLLVHTRHAGFAHARVHWWPRRHGLLWRKALQVSTCLFFFLLLHTRHAGCAHARALMEWPHPHGLLTVEEGAAAECMPRCVPAVSMKALHERRFPPV